MGKTALCCQWVYQCVVHNRFAHYAWIDCTEGVRAGLSASDLYSELGLNADPHRLCLSLSALDHVLLVLDNLPWDQSAQDHETDQQLIEELARTGVHLVATSRQQNELFKDHAVGFLDESHCMDLYREFHNRGEADTIRAIVKLAGFHTLTIELIAKTADAIDCTSEAMLARLQTEGFDLESIETPVDYRMGGQGFNQQLIEALKKLYDIAVLSADEQELLYCLGHFDGHPFVRSWVQQWFALPGPERINALIAKGWISRANHDKQCRLHPVISELARQGDGLTERYSEESLDRILGSIRETIEGDYFNGRYPGDYYLLPALESLTASIDNNSVALARVLHCIADRLEDKASYAEALPLYHRALSIKEKALGPEHSEVGGTLNYLAVLYGSIGEYAKALPLFNRALSIREKALGPEHPDVGQALHNLAGLYNFMGEYAKALPLCQRSLSIREKALGPEHQDVGQTLNNLAALYKSMGETAKALPLHKRALLIREKALGPEHQDVGLTLHNLAFLYDSMGETAKALLLYKRALSIREKALGPEHPEVGTTLNNLALLYKSMGETAKALPLCKRALSIAEKALGPEHPDVGTMLNNLAGLFESMGETAKVLPLYKRALSITEHALGLEHPSVGTTLNNLAFLYESMGETAEVLPLCKRALSIYEKALGSDHPNTKIVRKNLADFERGMEKA